MNLSERMIAALEYPPLRWAYLFGVWFSVLMCVVLFAIPAIKILKNKNIKIFIVFLILVLDVNSYNGITTQSDQMNGWGEWIKYAVIASVIALITTGFVYFITESKQFLICMNMIIERKVKR